eukprot:scaffold1305_cov112-Cylindrotheca_fusiformis.AAC.2
MSRSDDEVPTNKHPLQMEEGEKISLEEDSGDEEARSTSKQPKGASSAKTKSHQGMRFDLPAGPNVKRVRRPELRDILFGRGRGFQENPGNQRMLDIIDGYRQVYRKQKRNKKREFVEAVYEEITKDGTRFMKKIEEEDCWVEVSIPMALDKISHTLRGKRKGIQSPQLPEKSASEFSPSNVAHPIQIPGAAQMPQRASFDPLQSGISQSFPLAHPQNQYLNPLANQFSMGTLPPGLAATGMPNQILPFYGASPMLRDPRLVPNFGRLELLREHQLLQAAQNDVNARFETLRMQQQQQQHMQMQNNLRFGAPTPSSVSQLPFRRVPDRKQSTATTPERQPSKER